MRWLPYRAARWWHRISTLAWLGSAVAFCGFFVVGGPIIMLLTGPDVQRLLRAGISAGTTPFHDLPTYSLPAGGVFALLGIVTWLSWVYCILADSQPLKKDDDFFTLPPPPEVENFVSSVKERMGLRGKAVNLKITPLVSAPAVFATRTSISLLLPVSFLSLVKADGRVAEALVAHELAHVLHGDARMIRLARVVADHSLKVFFVVVFFSSLVAVIDDFFSGEPSYGTLQHLLSYAVMCFLWTVSMIINSLFCIVLLPFIFVIKRTIRRSELLADRSALHAGIEPDVLKRAIAIFQKPEVGWFLTSYPSLKHRNANIDALQRAKSSSVE